MARNVIAFTIVGSPPRRNEISRLLCSHTFAGVTYWWNTEDLRWSKIYNMKTLIKLGIKSQSFGMYHNYSCHKSEISTFYTFCSCVSLQTVNVSVWQKAVNQIQHRFPFFFSWFPTRSIERPSDTDNHTSKARLVFVWFWGSFLLRVQ